MKNMILMAYSLVNKPLNLMGFELALERKSRALFHKRITNIKSIGFSPSVIYDGGAYDGSWSARVQQKVFPAAQMVIIEPNKAMHPKISRNTSEMLPRPLLVDCALGAKPGAGHLNIWSKDTPTGSSLLDHVQGKAERQPVAVTTLDSLAERTRLIPDFVKLDLQGGELDALRGAKALLNTVELWVIEFGVLDAYIGRTTPLDLIQVMYLNDYVLYDITDIMYRPYDQAMLGGDFFFLKSDSPLRKHKGYR